MFASFNLQRSFVLTVLVVVFCVAAVNARPLKTVKGHSNAKAIPAQQNHVLILGPDGDAGCKVIRSEKQFQDLGIALSRAEKKTSTKVEVVYSVAQSTFEVTYTDFPAAAQAAFQRAVDIWAARVSSTSTTACG